VGAGVGCQSTWPLARHNVNADLYTCCVRLFRRGCVRGQLYAFLFGVFSSSGKAYLSIDNNVCLTSSNEYASAAGDGAWHHVAVMYSASANRAWYAVDGTVVHTRACSASKTGISEKGLWRACAMGCCILLQPEVGVSSRGQPLCTVSQGAMCSCCLHPAGVLGLGQEADGNNPTLTTGFDKFDVNPFV
jgi:hypothetical protein